MMLHAVIESAGGAAFATKRATDPEARRRLTAEAHWLEQAAHPGVVEVAGFDSTAERLELRTRFAGRPLSTLGPMPLARTCELVASAATTVADLHDLGIVHGRVDASHVLLGGDGRVRLCGFAEANSAHDGPRSRADDVASLGSLLDELAARAIGSGGRRRDREAHAAIRSLVARATAPDPLARPTARAVAASLRSHAPVPDTAQPQRRPIVSRAMARRVLSGTAGVALVVAGLRAFDPSPPTAGPGVAPSAERRPSSPRATGHGPAAVTSTAPRATSTSVARCAAIDGRAADVDGDGCDDAVFVSGPLVEVLDRRYIVGRLGDLATVGDWDCDGTATPALLRPSTGEVFLFDAWARPGDDVEVTALDRVDGAVTITSEALGAGCDGVTVMQRDGTRAAVWPPAEAR